ncbi:MAG: hypothetical protein JRI45_11100 [Deltaproteobacteria bacterium]|nr:hypothetical protein [Deltaproteobacteria bacterium]
MEVLTIETKDSQTAKEIVELITQKYGASVTIRKATKPLPDVFYNPPRVDSYDQTATFGFMRLQKAEEKKTLLKGRVC